MTNAGKSFKSNWTIRRFLLCAGLLALFLALLFRQNFQSGMVAFSNDAPFGQTVCQQALMPQILLGQWLDLNSMGNGAGSATPNISNLIKLFWEWPLPSTLGALGFANTYTPIAIFILGLGALFFFRQLNFSPMASFLGSLAVMFNSTFFGGACWGVASLEIAMGFNFFAMALVMANTPETPLYISLMRLALAGLCVGMNVMESSDIGALASVLMALFAFYHSLANGTGPGLQRAVHGVWKVGLVALFAIFIAFQSVVTLLGVAVIGVAGTSQDNATKAAHWDFATQWSLPKVETLGLVVPGLFGYKMDTPNEMPGELQPFYEGGLYWGGMGRAPVNDRFLESGASGPLPEPDWMRQTGSANYCGIVVVVVGIWTVLQALRRKESVFQESELRWIYFWTIVLVCSLLLAWGRFAPFYALLYKLPYFSTIRNPTKFVIFLGLAWAILFTYGMNVLCKNHFNSRMKTAPLSSIKGWWENCPAFDRRWVAGSGIILVLTVIAWWIYGSEKQALVAYLQKVGFPDESMAGQIASFSIASAGWFVILLGITLSLVTFTLTGIFNGRRARWGLGLLLALMLFDFVRADLPYIIHWDYFKKYEVGTLNPVESFLAQKPYENRVAVLPFDAQTQLKDYDNNFGGLGMYRIEWAQHHFPYYNIQSLDIIQMPRMPEDLKTYLENFIPQSMTQMSLYGRFWQLTNTRYLLGAAGFLDVLNSRLDPGKNRFRIIQRFDLDTKKGVIRPQGLEDLTAYTNSDGDLALFEFTGALPRASLYGAWQVNTNDSTVLKTLADPAFHPTQSLLLDTPPTNFPAMAANTNAGTVTYQAYDPNHITLSANVTQPSILLLNDRYDPHWSVTVDGHSVQLLRCNYIMRGICLAPGIHSIKFRFQMDLKPLILTLAAILLGVLLAILLALDSRQRLEKTNQ